MIYKISIILIEINFQYEDGKVYFLNFWQLDAKRVGEALALTIIHSAAEEAWHYAGPFEITDQKAVCPLAFILVGKQILHGNNIVFHADLIH